MKPLLIITLLVSLFGQDRFSGKKIIALQPLNNYGTQGIETICEELGRFYDEDVHILSPINIPPSFYNDSLKQYSADSVIHMLSGLRSQSTIEIIGITHDQLYTIKHSDSANIPFYDMNIFGLGYIPGDACVVSDNRLTAKDSSIFQHRVLKVMKHEIGHNKGLPHCHDETCLMSASNGMLFILDRPNDNYCSDCRKKVQ